MSALTKLLDTIQEARAEAFRLERAVAQYPDEPALRLSLKSVEKWQNQLEGQFRSLADKSQLEVVSYRVFNANDAAGPPLLPAITRALTDFQDLFSLVFDALRIRQPKRNARIGQDVEDVTTFGYGYSFSGSVGFVLTLPDSRVLIGDTDIERAMDTVFGLSRARSADEIQSVARQLGPAPLRSMFRWASDHVRYDTGVELTWLRDNTERGSLLVQPPEFAALLDAIQSVSDAYEEAFEITGVLVGADLRAGSFRLEPTEGDEIRGRMADFVLAEWNEKELTLRKMYRAKLSKTTTISYAKDEEQVTWRLTGLSEP